jgi:NADH-quinone oxidoreductase subunit N
MVLCLGGLMVMVGIAFKLSAVPFHFWCPDVFEGASAEVNAFLSVASKAAALALLVRVAVGFGYVPAAGAPDPASPSVAMFNVAAEQAPAAPPAGATPPADDLLLDPAAERGVTAGATPGARLVDPLRDQHNYSLAPARNFMARLLVFVAVITCTFGNLAAYGQKNIKRLLAYSTIAQAGYMIMPVPAALVLADSDPIAARAALSSMAFYAGVYVFMNLGAFAVVAFLRNTLHSEQIADYAGLIRRAPIVTICFAAILISLIGLPPLAGFVGKLQIFYSLVQAKLYALLFIAGLNTALSLYYYLRVVKTMTIDPEPEDRVPATISFIPATFVVLVTLPLLVLGIWWNSLYDLTAHATRQLF